ncbi:MAG: HU family DNA-binding protein [Mobilicoccus sp.]|nr:HU family DNA-binding protein [Mobilicoccus sp.]
MNKADLVDALEARLGGKKAASDAIEAIFDVIIREVAQGGKVGITGFGTFERVDRAARTGRNPRTGESVRIDSTAVPKFRPGTAFKMYVAEPATLPKSGPAAARAAAGTAAEVRAAAEAAIAASKGKKGKSGRKSA